MARSEDASEGERRGGNRTILLVEDERPLRHVTKRVLERHGYTVLEAESSEQARGIASGHRGLIELLLTDIKLPGGDGRELAQQLRRTQPDLKVLFMSGYPDDILVSDGLRIPDTEFLQKPYHVDELLHKVREVLDR